MGMIVLAVLVLVFIFIAYMGAKHWPVWHVVLLSGVFLGALGFCILGAMALKTHSKFRKQYADSEKELAVELKRTELLMSQVNPADPDHQSVNQIEGNVKRTLVDRGRVWRNPEIRELDRLH